MKNQFETEKCEFSIKISQLEQISIFNGKNLTQYSQDITIFKKKLV